MSQFKICIAQEIDFGILPSNITSQVKIPPRESLNSNLSHQATHRNWICVRHNLEFWALFHKVTV